MDIFLVRHGQSTGNGTGRLIGWSDHPLTALGRAQAGAVAARLASFGPMPVFCSDLTRARQTAEVIAARWAGDIQPDTRWREISCGRYEDCTWDDFNRNVELALALDHDPLGAVMPEGESVEMMLARVHAAFGALCTTGEERAVVVGHDGSIRSVLYNCLNIPPDRFWTFTTDHCGLTHLIICEGWVSIRTVNDTSHLGDLLHSHR